MVKLSFKKLIFHIILSYLLSVLLYQIIFAHSDILAYFTSNNFQDYFLGGWPFLWIFTLIIFLLISLFPRNLTWKNNLLITALVIFGIFIQKISSNNIIGYILSCAAVWKILIFSLSLVLLLDMEKIKDKIGGKRLNLGLNVLIGFLLLMYFLVPVMNHLNFKESGLDMGIYGQALWKYAHFKYPSNTLDHYWGIKNMLGDHFEIILPLISPLFWFSKSILTLHIFNGLAIALGSYFLYLLAKLKLRGNTVLSKFIVIIFLAFTGLQMAFMEGQFHPLSYVPVLIILIIYFIEIKKWWAYFLSLLFLLSIKESMGLYVVFIGLYVFLFQRKYWKIALITVGLGVIHYLTTVRAVEMIFGSKYLYFNYGRLGETNTQVLKTIITNPFYALYVFFTPIAKIETLSLILGSFGFLVFAPPLLIAVPMFGERFLTSDQHIWHFFMHYNTPLAGVLICSLVFFFSQTYFADKKTFFKKYLSKNIGVYSLMIFVLISTCLININYRSDIVSFFYKFKKNIVVDQDSKDILEAAKVVPKNAAVSTQNALVTHFTSRDKIYQFPVNLDAEYIVACSAKDYWLLTEKEYRDFLNNSVDAGYGIKFYKNHTLVLQKNYQGELKTIPESFFK